MSAPSDPGRDALRDTLYSPSGFSVGGASWAERVAAAIRAEIDAKWSERHVNAAVQQYVVACIRTVQEELDRRFANLEMWTLRQIAAGVEEKVAGLRERMDEECARITRRLIAESRPPERPVVGDDGTLAPKAASGLATGKEPEPTTVPPQRAGEPSEAATVAAIRGWSAPENVPIDRWRNALRAAYAADAVLPKRVVEEVRKAVTYWRIFALSRPENTAFVIRAGAMEDVLELLDRHFGLTPEAPDA